jgi:hypothetical protein
MAEPYFCFFISKSPALIPFIIYSFTIFKQLRSTAEQMSPLVFFQRESTSERAQTATGSAAFVSSVQGCQMVYFQTKNPNLGNFWRDLEWKGWYIIWLFKIYYGHLGTFLAIW